MKTTVTLPFVKETPGTVVYGLRNVTSVAIGQVYVRKENLEKIGGVWPSTITLTLETSA